MLEPVQLELPYPALLLELEFSPGAYERLKEINELDGSPSIEDTVINAINAFDPVIRRYKEGYTLQAVRRRLVYNPSGDLVDVFELGYTLPLLTK